MRIKLPRFTIIPIEPSRRLAVWASLVARVARLVLGGRRRGQGLRALSVAPPITSMRHYWASHPPEAGLRDLLRRGYSLPYELRDALGPLLGGRGV